MTVDTQASLCGTCHDAVKDQAEKSTSRHRPVVDGECTQCHNPHQAALPGLMLARTPDLCLTCHKTLKASLADGHVHPPAARDCLRCHTPHAAAEKRLLAQPVVTLCASCHDVATAAFGDAHVQIDPARMHCARCHDSHASKDPKFFKANAHAPFAAKSCTDCHLEPKPKAK
jgi:predicted CXXCH cytochrome family protein